MPPRAVSFNNPLYLSKEDLEITSSCGLWERVVTQHQDSSCSPFVPWWYVRGPQRGCSLDVAQRDGRSPPETCSESVFPQ